MKNHVNAIPTKDRYCLWRDVLIVIILSATAGYASFQGAGLIDDVVVLEQGLYDIWFDGDMPRVYHHMTSVGDIEDTSRGRHPLFSLVAFPPVYLLRKGLGIEPNTSVKVVIATVVSLWTLGLYAILRLIGCRRPDAALFSVLAMTSASAVFWFVVPETYPFGSLTILLAVALVGIAQYRHLSSAWYVAVSALTLSITITNWMAGILATVVQHSWKRSLQITVNALCVATVLWAVQKLLFPSAVFFIGSYNINDPNIGNIPHAGSGGPLHILKSFVFHTMIMPAIQVTYFRVNPNFPVMTVQPSLPGSGSIWGTLAVPLWVALVGFGLWGLLSIKEHPQFRLVLALTLVGQLVLHLVFGREVFLFSLHFMPLLVILAALALLTRARLLVLSLAGTLAILLAINNAIQFQKARQFVQHEVAQEGYIVRNAMKYRPADPWPRGAGQVVLATPGSNAAAKAYHQPGGSFSPAVGSFGVSIWIGDTQGTVKTTSDDIPLNFFRQQFVWSSTKSTPAILTEATHYRTLWDSEILGRWALSLTTPPNAAIKPMIAIRSVGPAGGPIYSLQWERGRLVINNRWNVAITPNPVAIHLGKEGQHGWMKARSDLTRWNDHDGWGYARLELVPGRDYRVLITDTNSRSPDDASWSATQSSLAMNRPEERFELVSETVRAPAGDTNLSASQSTLAIELPDDRFAASLHAQVAHMLMGLVSNETRPGDPVSYPFAWLRDEAYIIVGLARSGELTVAKQLSKHLAENDFFGGFGAEADAPGLAIWALVDVAMQLKEPEFERWVWPHVRRKAELILDMLSTNHSIHKPILTPVIPLYTKPLAAEEANATLVSEPSRDGLIVGRVHNSRPVLYVNALSYRGLLDAAILAERVGRVSEANSWRTRGVELKQAWFSARETTAYSDKWTYNIWPTSIADQTSTRFVAGLQARYLPPPDIAGYSKQSWTGTHFDAAQAHHWLLLGRADCAWSILTQFWNNQASPGLYTWAEISKESTSRNWEQFRGWLKPWHFTPHYRTAAEILLLQLAMLAYPDKAAREPTLVIAAGIQPSWLERRMRVQGLSTPLGQVDWTWDGQQMHVRVRGSQAHVRLGPAFKANTPLHVEYLG